MKKFYQLLMISLIWALPLHAQDYIPFPKDSTVWSTVDWMQDFSPVPQNPEYMIFSNTSYKVKGTDTLINSKLYSIVYSSPHTDFGSFYFVSALIREDSSKRVYLYEKGKEWLIYDFGLAVGDTFFAANDHRTEIMVLKNISPVLLNDSSTRRKFVFDVPFTFNYTEVEWIEGIGDVTTTPFHYLDPMSILADAGTFFTCFWQDGQYLIGGSNCAKYTGIAESGDPEKVVLSPNPFNEAFSIENRYPHEAEVTVYDGLSRPVIKQRIPGGSKSYIDLTGRPQGMYIVVIYDGEIQSVRKVIKK